LSFLLDTNVVSEWVKSRPDSGVITWLAETDEHRVFLSVVTLAELRYGIERMPPGARQKRLNTWLTEELTLRFEGRILPIGMWPIAGGESWRVVRRCSAQ
jgi:toxin FitB